MSGFRTVRGIICGVIIGSMMWGMALSVFEIIYKTGLMPLWVVGLFMIATPFVVAFAIRWITRK